MRLQIHSAVCVRLRWLLREVGIWAPPPCACPWEVTAKPYAGAVLEL